MTTWLKAHDWYLENRKEVIEMNTEYKVINRVRHYAHKDTYKKILDGELVRPTHCPSCGSTKNIEAYYKRLKPYVTFDWSCRSCSQRRRRAKRRSK